MDDLDRRIVDAVQNDAGRSIGALAEATGSTPATCHRRYGALKRSGIIQKIVALTDETQSREPLTVLVGISIKDQSSAAQRRLRDFLRCVSEVKMAWMTTGEFDYFIVGAFADVGTYLKFVETNLEANCEIAGYRTFISMDAVKFNTARSFQGDKS